MIPKMFVAYIPTIKQFSKQVINGTGSRFLSPTPPPARYVPQRELEICAIVRFRASVMWFQNGMKTPSRFGHVFGFQSPSLP